MSQLFRNKYRITSTRLQSWNYANPGMYFITICTKNHAHYFGEIVVADAQCNAYLRQSAIGQIAHSEWLKTPEIRPDMNLQLGEFVIMPDHMHGIVIIGDNHHRRDAMHRVSDSNPDETQFRDAMHCVSTIAPQSKNLASIIRGYKSAVTTFARKNGILFDWQPRYYDHIIRSMDEYERISEYIVNNAYKWAQKNNKI
ncbi:hypothetical protein QTN47_25020 [Danxiaibacter flavus]|uniref:Transposase IS200-like domain-containing protein n=1 Tax=Danxiaibacter flavus TaxID=3049108 RepID=A0ABV3ZNS1_9BACT|nr:hypothetical protein QNM32_25025 [Chitinophagaceae bacterium DXS]